MMGCFQSKTAHLASPDKEAPEAKPDLGEGEGEGEEGEEEQVPAFKEFVLADLRAATNGFSSELIVSESGDKAPNVVYRGRLKNNRLVAIKRFSRQSWPDPHQFVTEAAGLGNVRHKRLVNLIGCCAEGDERLLVAQYMPNDTLSKHLFHCTLLTLFSSFLAFFLSFNLSLPSTHNFLAFYLISSLLFYLIYIFFKNFNFRG